MKRYVLFTLFGMGAIIANAQDTITVSIGAGGINDVWYNIDSDETNSASATNWDIAFQIGGLADGSVMVNSANGRKLFVYPGDIEDWATVDTTGMNWDELFNNPKDWKTGAFNSIKDINEQFDYGWGDYVPAYHGLIGKSLYILKLSNSDYRKIKIDSLNGYTGLYKFTYANLDGSNEISSQVNKNDYTGYNFIYYSVSGDAVIDNREPKKVNEWDLLFTNYIDLAPNPFTQVLEMAKAGGVLASPGLEIAQVDGVDPENYMDWFGANYSFDMNTIGHDWKNFNMNATPPAYEYVTDRVYFVKANSGNVWKLVFFNYGGASNGNIIFWKELMSEASLDKNNLPQANAVIYPNPATSQVSVLLNNFGNTDMSLSITNILGEVVYQENTPNTGDLNLKTISTENFKSGTYFIHIRTKNKGITKKLIIQ